MATAQAKAFPPYVLPCSPGLIQSIISSLASTAETGKTPPDKAFPNIKISALKPYFGHNLGGNVLLEIAAVLVMLNKDVIFPTLNVEPHNLINDFNIVTKMEEGKITYALKITNAFAGFYSAIVLKKFII